MPRSARVWRTAGRLRWPASFGDGLDFGSGFAEGFDFFAGRGGGGQDQEIGCIAAIRGADELRVERDAEVGVEDDAEQGATAGLTAGAENAAAVGEWWVVGEDGADAGEDGVGGVAEALDLGAGRGAGEPVRLVGGSGLRGGGEVAVDGKGGLEGDEGRVVLDEVGEGVVEVAGGLLEDAESDFDSGGAEFGDALAADLGVGVFGGDDDTGDAGGDEGVGAGAGSSVVGAGLEGDVGGGSGGVEAAFAGLLEGGDLGVVAVVVEVSAFGEDFVVADEDAADLRVGRGESHGFASEGEGSLHEGFVVERGGHPLYEDSLQMYPRCNFRE